MENEGNFFQNETLSIDDQKFLAAYKLELSEIPSKTEEIQKRIRIRSSAMNKLTDKIDIEVFQQGSREIAEELREISERQSFLEEKIKEIEDKRFGSN